MAWIAPVNGRDEPAQQPGGGGACGVGACAAAAGDVAWIAPVNGRDEPAQ